MKRLSLGVLEREHSCGMPWSSQNLWIGLAFIWRPQSLIIATADVTLTGWRLDRIADTLRDGDFLAVRSLPSRYANLDKTKCSVATITVEPVNNGCPVIEDVTAINFATAL